MNQEEKNIILKNRQILIKKAQKRASEEKAKLDIVFNRTKSEIARMSAENQAIHFRLYEIAEKRYGELKSINNTPFFVRMTAEFRDRPGQREICIGKFSLPEENIYSWVTPVAALRFSNTGPASYALPSGKERIGQLLDNEIYTIVDGQISYLSRTDIKHGKTLIYQQHFSEKLTEFGLSEVVAQMEKVQDTIVRASPPGPFLISGPAGSGKTTVALHRIAFLKQSPDTSEIYNNSSCLVFVQDTSTKKYFSKLLPSLGINNVKITTFSEWSLNILELEDEYSYSRRTGKYFEQKNKYEFWKVHLLDNNKKNIKYHKNPFQTLEQIYKDLPDQLTILFEEQKRTQTLDKQDLTLLLHAYSNSKGSLEETKMYYAKKPGKSNQVIRKYKKVSVSYKAILVDEFQNYTPKQLEAIRSVLHKDTKTIIYVGDLNQQTHIGSIQSWDEIGESFTDDRKVQLQQVYRNSSSILEFMRTIGYDTPLHKSEGTPIGTAKYVNALLPKDQSNYILKLLPNLINKRIAILALDEEYLGIFRETIPEAENVHILSIADSQGLEFDIVFVAGLHQQIFATDNDSINPPGYQEAYQDTITDFLYVACTRAKSDLYIFADLDTEKSINTFVSLTKKYRMKKVT